MYYLSHKYSALVRYIYADLEQLSNKQLVSLGEDRVSCKIIQQSFVNVTTMKTLQFEHQIN